MADDLVTVGSFTDPIQAELAKNLLEDSGIKTFLIDEATVSMAWFLSTALQGIKLQVRPEDADEARQILYDVRRQSAAAIEDEIGDEDGPDEPPEEPLNDREQLADRALRCAILGLLLFPFELYASWLVLQVFLSDQPLRPAKRRNAMVAGVINVVAVLAFGAWLRAYGWGLVFFAVC